MQTNFKKAVMMGLGYIGLPTASILASRGVEVLGVDVNPKVIDIINSGKIHIVEPDLDMLVHGAVTAGKLKASLEPTQADVFLIAVPTPFKEDHKPDLSAVKSACNMIAPFLQKGSLVILESTSPVGTTEQLSQWLSQKRKDLSFPHTHADTPDVNVAYCPERVLPGRVLEELVHNDRIIGGMTPVCSQKAKAFYEIFVQGACLLTNARTAEMCKLTENSFLDVNIAFANELSMICDDFDINVWELIRLANHHPRVNILNPGAGVGGHCIAVDPWFIVDSSPKYAHLIKTARLVNDAKPSFVVDQVKAMANALEKPVIACLGLAFKPDIDDLRESPALYIAQQLDKDYQVVVVEPHIDALPNGLSQAGVLETIENAIQKADIICVLVAHKTFSKIDPAFLNDKMVIDACGLWKQ